MKYMVYYRDNLANISLKAVCQKAENDLESARKAELLTRNEEKTFLRVNTFLENIWLKMEGITQAECDIYEKVKEAFSREADDLEKLLKFQKKIPMSGQKQLLQRRLTVWKLRQNISLRRFRMFLILWKLPLVIARKW